MISIDPSTTLPVGLYDIAISSSHGWSSVCRVDLRSLSVEQLKSSSVHPEERVKRSSDAYPGLIAADLPEGFLLSLFLGYMRVRRIVSIILSYLLLRLSLNRRFASGTTRAKVR